jgi:cytoskeleton protein RodZ
MPLYPKPYGWASTPPLWKCYARTSGARIRFCEVGSMSIGAQLRTAREEKGLSLGTLAQRIRVQPRALAAIEIDDLSGLPPRPFGRGFIRAYAREVDLDPDRVVHDYFAQFPASTESQAPPPRQSHAYRDEDSQYQVPSQWTNLAAALLVLVLVVASAMVLGRRASPARETEAVGTTGAAPATPATDPRASAATPAVKTPPAAEPKPAAPADTARAPLMLTLTATRACWVTASADGRRTTYRTLQAGDREAINAEKEIVIRVGDAGAISWAINGRTGEPLGANGAVRDLRLTPGNAATAR